MCPVELQNSGYTGDTMRMTLDTSVLVAAARSRNGASFKLVSMLPTPEIEIALTVPLYTEWQAVMTRPENLPPGATAEDARAFLRYLASIAHLQEVHFLWRPFSRDPDDDMIVECAVSSGCEYIVTHNAKDFRRVEELNVQVIAPADLLNLLRGKP